MKRSDLLYKILNERTLVLDGAMGTTIQTFGLTEKDFRGDRFRDFQYPLNGNNDLLCLTRPEIIEKIHISFLEAGADIIETNTFNANRISQADYHLEDLVYEINFKAAQIASRLAARYTEKNPEKPRFVAGSVGPTNKTASMSPDVNDPGYRAVTFDFLKEIYYEQFCGLLDGGVDILLLETIFDTLNAKAALFAVEQLNKERNIQIPVMVSATISDASGRTLSGQTMEAFINSVSHVRLLSLGLNCSLGARELRPFIKEIAAKVPFFVSAHPNAGLPDQFGNYTETPDEMASYINEYLQGNYVNIIGGCCGTTPEHIKKISELVKQYPLRKSPSESHKLKLSGLEPLTVFEGSNFINIGERTNVSGSKKFARLIREQKYEEALSIAREQVENGAQIIDVCLDDAMLDAEKEMTTFLNLIMSEPEIARVPVMIDSSKWEVIEAGLKCVQGKAIVNSLSLKEGEKIFIEQAEKVKNYGAALVVMAFDEEGQADSLEKKITTCRRAYDILTKKVAFPPEDIIFDPNLLTIATGMEEHDNYAVDFIEAVKWIKQNLPYAKVSGGISNLSFSFRGNDKVREAMHSVFLYHAIKAGLDMGIVNPAMLQLYSEIPEDLLQLTEDVILNKNKYASEKLISYAEKIRDTVKTVNSVQDDWREKSLEDRIQYSLLKGIADHIDRDMTEAHEKYGLALKVIEGPLMDAMNHIGDLFADGKMFLPQVVKSARVMKKAVAILQPYIEKEKTSSEKSNISGKILLATVKGDVHDIGKNIVGVVLGCNNYEVIDLGVMSPSEKILSAAREREVDIIGLSGLITPSLEEMVHVAAEMEKQNFKIPLLIGGATTSKIHTAVKIEPHYSQSVIHVKDASRSIPVISKLLNPESKQRFISEIREEYEALRKSYETARKEIEYISLEEARKNSFKYDWKREDIIKPSFLGLKTLKNYSLAEIRDYISWVFFFVVWELRGKFPDILSDPAKGAEATKLFEDANEMLNRIIREEWLSANAVFGFYPANSVGDDIEVYTDETRTNILTRFINLRNQNKKYDSSPNLCLADFIAPKSTGIIDYIGAFAVTAGIGAEEKIRNFEKENDDYNSIMLKALADRLAEAFTELLHLKIRKEYWGYSKDENLTIEDLLLEKYSGIRPAHGYPACPDHSEKETLFRLLNAKNNAGIYLTENYSMVPPASVSGLIFSHPFSRYFHVGKISEDQVEDYAKRKQITKDTVKKLLASNLNF